MQPVEWNGERARRRLRRMAGNAWDERGCGCRGECAPGREQLRDGPPAAIGAIFVASFNLFKTVPGLRSPVPPPSVAALLRGLVSGEWEV